MMLDEDRCRRAIGEAFPALELRSVRYFNAGWDYELWEINGDLLFRFPLRDECAAALPIEARLLHELAEHVSVAIPQPEYVSTGVESFPQPFFAYRKLAGVPISEASLGDAPLASLGRQIGAFLRELHGFPSEQAAALGLPVYTAKSWRTFYTGFRAQCDSRVNSLLSVAERAGVDAFWNEFLDNDANFRFTPTLVHADLGPEHVLVDPLDSVLTAVIDFGDARIGDPAIDIVGLLRIEAALLKGYGTTDATFQQRARTYWRIGPLHEVLYGLDTDESEHIEAGLRGIRERIIEQR